VNTFNAFHTTRFISLFTKDAHYNPYWATCNHPAFCSRLVSGLSFHLRISVPYALLQEFPTEILYAFIIPGPLFRDRSDFRTQITLRNTLKIDAESSTETTVGIYTSAFSCRSNVLFSSKSHDGNVKHNCDVTGPFDWEVQ
jgi:hypothetical protein